VWVAHGRPCAAGAEEDGGGGKCGSDARNWVLGVAEQRVSVEVVLLRARGRELRRGSGLSTATRRWRPEMARGIVARVRKTTRGEERGRD
jgi:hypothetical protein